MICDIGGEHELLYWVVNHLPGWVVNDLQCWGVGGLQCVVACDLRYCR